MKTNNVRILTAMTSILLVMTVPSVFAQSGTDTHSGDAFPIGPQMPNTPFQIQSVHGPVAPNPAAVADIRAVMVYVFFSPSNTFPPPTLNQPLGVNVGAPEQDPTILNGRLACNEVYPNNAVGERMWILAHSPSGTFISSEHIDLGVNTQSTIWYDSVSPAPFGAFPNPSAVPGDGFGSGTPATAGTNNAGAAIFPPLGIGDSYYWQEVGNLQIPIAGQDSTAQAGTYFFLICAYIDANSDDDWGGFVNNPNGGPQNAGAETENVILGNFAIIGTVGGESMPISTMSLLLAGVQTNALWILPILGLAGTVIVIRKLEA